MNNEKNWNNLKKNFKLYHKGEFFVTFIFDTEFKRYQSDIGYLTIEDVYKISNGMDKDRKIEWI